MTTSLIKSWESAPTVNDLKSLIGFWMRFVSKHVSHAFARKLHNKHISVVEWVVLREMYDRKAIPPSVLANLSGMTRGAASKLIDKLVVKKLVTRSERREDDRRFQEISLTSSGRRLVPKLAAIADENDSEYFATLSKGEREMLVTVLKKLVETHNLRKLPIQ